MAVRIAARAIVAPLRFNSVHSRACLTRALSTVVETPSILSSTPPAPPPPPHIPQQSSRSREIETDQDAEHGRRQQAKRILQDAVAATAPRHNWTREEVAAIYYQPLMELAFQAVSSTSIKPEHLNCLPNYQ
jgi:biotin synthase